MRTLASLRKQEQRLRVLHSKQTKTGMWREAETTRHKLIACLDQITSAMTTGKR
jgi:hypothetical protein